MRSVGVPMRSGGNRYSAVSANCSPPALKPAVMPVNTSLLAPSSWRKDHRVGNGNLIEGSPPGRMHHPRHPARSIKQPQICRNRVGLFGNWWSAEISDRSMCDSHRHLMITKASGRRSWMTSSRLWTNFASRSEFARTDGRMRRALRMVTAPCGMSRKHTPGRDIAALSQAGSTSGRGTRPSRP
jgi:hypothetical protein